MPSPPEAPKLIAAGTRRMIGNRGPHGVSAAASATSHPGARGGLPVEARRSLAVSGPFSQVRCRRASRTSTGWSLCGALGSRRIEHHARQPGDSANPNERETDQGTLTPSKVGSSRRRAHDCPVRTDTSGCWRCRGIDVRAGSVLLSRFPSSSVGSFVSFSRATVGSFVTFSRSSVGSFVAFSGNQVGSFSTLSVDRGGDGLTLRRAKKRIGATAWRDGFGPHSRFYWSSSGKSNHAS